jgi:hypothetical protein
MRLITVLLSYDARINVLLVTYDAVARNDATELRYIGYCCTKERFRWSTMASGKYMDTRASTKNEWKGCKPAIRGRPSMLITPDCSVSTPTYTHSLLFQFKLEPHLATKHTHTHKTNSVALSPLANYTNWAIATCRRNLEPTFADRGVSRGKRGGSPTIVNLSFLDRSRYFSFK